MKRSLPFSLLLLLYWLLAHQVVGQKKINNHTFHPPTILWKITGKEGIKPSYLLGTLHLADAEWLYEYPEMKRVIDSTEFILTEVFTTEPVAPPTIPPQKQLKALPLLTKKQYNTLDSFFVARVGEGIRENPEAENMTVAEMRAAIQVTLASQTKGPNGMTTFMDLDLFKLYEKRGRKGDRLDRIPLSEFDSTTVEQAKHYVARSLSFIEGSDKPDWNIYHQTGIKEIVARYKNMEFEDDLNKQAEQGQTSPDFDFVPMEVRNKNWMHKITSAVSSKPTLIAVGLAHLYYQTGVIQLLRERGYRVEPVMLRKP